MQAPEPRPATTDQGRTAPAPLLAVAWVVLLGASLLPRVVVQEVLGRDFTDDARLLVSASVIATAFVAAAVWERLRPLVPFLTALGVLVAAEALVYRVIDRAPAYRAWLADPSFPTYMLAEQSLRLMVTVIVIAALLVLRRRPSRFFLAVGDLHAPMRRIPWLGVKDGTRWSRFGPLAAAGLSAGTLAFVLLAGAPAPDVIARAAPLLPVILLAATLNAFSEEVAWKASLLSVLEGPVGPRQAVLMVAAYFGLGHYYGIPYGVIGVAMAFALGWLLARSMVETRGLFWAWFIHFCQDVIIFSFLAIGSITPGGA